MLAHIKAIHAETRVGYGWPRTWKELLARSSSVGKVRVQKLMQLHGIRAKGKQRFKVTTDSHHGLPISPNLRNKKFVVAEPYKVWVGDLWYATKDVRHAPKVFGITKSISRRGNCWERQRLQRDAA